MISVQEQDFELGAEYSLLRKTAGDAGAIATFTGLVREIYDESHAGHSKVSFLHLEHYPGMTEKSLQDIVDQANQRWSLLATRLVHRIGHLNPGDQIVFVGTASAHRQDAFDAAQFIMDYLKNKAPFWKKQGVDESAVWVESSESDKAALSKWGKTST
jgi:molybdopterin synthase catalytic subunit|tara:strand:+ start:837 stop:1310 length:474 start_codon:yes stop_codon:yes gene_type:complete